MNSVSKIRYLTRIEQLEKLGEEETERLRAVEEKFPFRCNDYYLSLIDWAKADDPIRRIIVPCAEELNEWGRPDPSDETSYTVMHGLEHKYNSTALLLVSNVCEGICRYCFRKRVFARPQKEYLRDLEPAARYIREHSEITNVLLTGGDPLVLTTSKLEKIIGSLREISHVRIIRVGTKMPAFNPFRIIEDPSLLEMINKYSTPEKKLYVMTHFVHPRELTDSAVGGRPSSKSRCCGGKSDAFNKRGK